MGALCSKTSGKVLATTTTAEADKPDLLLSAKLGLDPDEQPISTAYTFKGQLGQGAFGVVHEVVAKDSGRTYACKVLSLSDLKIRNLKHEVAALKAISHPNIIHLYKVQVSEKFVYLLMEFAPHGELFDYVEKHGHVSERFTARVLLQIASALAHLHSHQIVHRDMKPENILIADEATFIVKLCDFGLSTIIGTGSSFVHTGNGAGKSSRDGAEHAGRLRSMNMGVIFEQSHDQQMSHMTNTADNKVDAASNKVDTHMVGSGGLLGDMPKRPPNCAAPISASRRSAPRSSTSSASSSDSLNPPNSSFSSKASQVERARLLRCMHYGDIGLVTSELVTSGQG